MAASRQPGSDRFPATQWSLVGRAAQLDPAARRQALEELLPRYLSALKAHLVHYRRLPPERADDLLQEFVARKVLQKDLIASADRRLGKFRTLLLTALDRFVRNQYRDQRARKRSASDGAVPFDQQQHVLPDQSRHCEAFDLEWAREVIRDALGKMRQECEASGRMQLWGIFECRVVGPILEGAPPVDYARLVEQFGFQSPSHASHALTTAKRMYARALRSAVGQYAQDEDEIESEIRDLRVILARCNA